MVCAAVLEGGLKVAVHCVCGVSKVRCSRVQTTRGRRCSRLRSGFHVFWVLPGSGSAVKSHAMEFCLARALCGRSLHSGLPRCRGLPLQLRSCLAGAACLAPDWVWECRCGAAAALRTLSYAYRCKAHQHACMHLPHTAFSALLAGLHGRSGGGPRSVGASAASDLAFVPGAWAGC